MLKFLKYLPILLKGKNVAEVFKSEGLNVKTKPFWLSRRFVGVLLMFIAAGIAKIFGVKILETDINSLGDAVIGIAEAATTAYATMLILVGYFKRDKKVKLGLKISAGG